MLKPQDGCPTGFEEGSMTQYVAGGKVSGHFNFDIKYDNDHFDFKFCTKTKKSQSSKAAWEPGQYCIFSYNGVCPKGMY